MPSNEFSRPREHLRLLWSFPPLLWMSSPFWWRSGARESLSRANISLLDDATSVLQDVRHRTPAVEPGFELNAHFSFSFARLKRFLSSFNLAPELLSHDAFSAKTFCLSLGRANCVTWDQRSWTPSILNVNLSSTQASLVFLRRTQNSLPSLRCGPYLSPDSSWTDNAT